MVGVDTNISSNFHGFHRNDLPKPCPCFRSGRAADKAKFPPDPMITPSSGSTTSPCPRKNKRCCFVANSHHGFEFTVFVGSPIFSQFDTSAHQLPRCASVWIRVVQTKGKASAVAPANPAITVPPFPSLLTFLALDFSTVVPTLPVHPQRQQHRHRALK